MQDPQRRHSSERKIIVPHVARNVYIGPAHVDPVIGEVLQPHFFYANYQLWGLKAKPALLSQTTSYRLQRENYDVGNEVLATIWSHPRHGSVFVIDTESRKRHRNVVVASKEYQQLETFMDLVLPSYDCVFETEGALVEIF